MLTVSLVSMGQKECVVNLEKSGKLGSVVNKKEIPSITKLTIKGGSDIVLDEKDGKFIEKMTALDTLDISGISNSFHKCRMPFSHIKHLILFDGNFKSTNHDSNETSYEKDIKDFEFIANLDRSLANEGNYYLRCFPNLQSLSFKNNIHLSFSICVPELIYFADYEDWRGAIKKDGTLLIEKKEIAKNFKGFHIISPRLVANGEELNLSEAIYIGKFAYWRDRGISKLSIPQSVRYIDREGCSGVKQVQFEEGDELLYVATYAFGDLNNKQIIINRPVFIGDRGFEHSCPELVEFNKDVVYIGEKAFNYEKGVKKLVFKKVPQNMANYFVCAIGDNYNFLDVVIPYGSKSEFLKHHIPESFLREQGTSRLALTVKLEKPNSILSVLPIDKLPNIDSLTIIGYMYETDVEVLNDCKNLRYLDLSRAYITYSPEEKKNIQQSQEAFKALFSFLGVAADAKYHDGNMTTLDYAFTKGFTRLVSESPDQISEADNGCIIPSRSFQKMKCLETVILPYRASKIGELSFKYCSSLKNVVLPPHLKRIGAGCFHGCKSLQNIDIPASVKSIGRADQGSGILDGEGSFTATGLTKLDLSKCVFDESTGPGGLVKWSFTARDNEALKEIRVPQGITHLELTIPEKEGMTVYFPASITYFRSSFRKNSTIHFKSMTPPKADDYTYKIQNSNVYVPKGSTTAYYSAFGSTNKYIEE